MDGEDLIASVRQMLERLDTVCALPGGINLMRQRLHVDLKLRPDLENSVVRRGYVAAEVLALLPESSAPDLVEDGIHPVLIGLTGDPEDPTLRVELDPHARPYSEPLLEVLEQHLGGS